METSEPVEAAAPDDSSVPYDAADAADAPETPEAPPSHPAPAKRKGRASVPSWDDVMFGAKRGDQG